VQPRGSGAAGQREKHATDDSSEERAVRRRAIDEPTGVGSEGYFLALALAFAFDLSETLAGPLGVAAATIGTAAAVSDLPEMVELILNESLNGMFVVLSVLVTVPARIET
jgi:hypothetical protein